MRQMTRSGSSVPRMDAARLKRAIDTRDLGELEKLVNVMRFRFRWDYQWCYHAAADASGIALADWDELLCEVDLRAAR